MRPSRRSAPPPAGVLLRVVVHFRPSVPARYSGTVTTRTARRHAGIARVLPRVRSDAAEGRRPARARRAGTGRGAGAGPNEDHPGRVDGPGRADDPRTPVATERGEVTRFGAERVRATADADKIDARVGAPAREILDQQLAAPWGTVYVRVTVTERFRVTPAMGVGLREPHRSLGRGSLVSGERGWVSQKH